jgi:hypothetical protein
VRRIPLSYRSHVTGFQGLPSGAIDYESALERDFVLLTLFDDPSARIRSQPVTLNFEHEGRHRRYTPDYLIEGGGRFELIEIKYEADLQRTCSVPQNGAGASVQPPRANSKGFTRSALAASPRPSLANGRLGSFAGYARDPDAFISHRSALIACHRQPARSGPIQWQHRTPTLMGMLPQIWFLETSLSEWLAEQTL